CPHKSGRGTAALQNAGARLVTRTLSRASTRSREEVTNLVFDILFAAHGLGDLAANDLTELASQPVHRGPYRAFAHLQPSRALLIKTVPAAFAINPLGQSVKDAFFALLRIFILQAFHRRVDQRQ